MHFRITGLPAEPFSDLLTMSDAELAQRHAQRRVADCKPGYPCRISLTEAEPGEQVLLVNYEHLAVDSPYRSSHAIYVRRGERRFDAVDTVPAMLRSRVLSLRGFDDAGLMTAADIVGGRELETAIAAMFADPKTTYLHVHFAKPGCYAARVDRA